MSLEPRCGGALLGGEMGRLCGGRSARHADHRSRFNGDS